MKNIKELNRFSKNDSLEVVYTKTHDILELSVIVLAFGMLFSILLSLRYYGETDNILFYLPIINFIVLVIMIILFCSLKNSGVSE